MIRSPLPNILLLSVLLLSIPSLTRADLRGDLNKGYELVDQWRIEEADDFVRELDNTYPNSGDVLFLKARVEFFKGDYDTANTILKEVEETEQVVKDFKGLVSRTQKASAKFVTKETEHFRIRYIDGPDEILIHFAEQVLEQSYKVLGGIIDYHPQEKVLVEIYPGREDFSKISPLTLKDIMTSGTVALCKYRRIMIITPASALRGYNWMDTLSHEFVHYLLSSASHNNVPLWLHEGIAKNLEARWRDGEQMTPIMETVLASGIQNDYLVKLKDMMPSFAKLKSAEDVQLAYAEVSTMVDYLIKLKGGTIISSLVKSLRQGTTFEEVIQKEVGMSLPAFQEAWKKDIKSKKLRTIPGLRVLRFEFKKKGEKTPENEEDIPSAFAAIGGKRTRDLVLLGDILKERNHVPAAIVEYEKALKSARSLSPVLYNKLGGTYLQEKQYDEARDLLTTTLGYYPDFPTTLVNLGELHYQKEEMTKAEDYFQRAIRLNPFNPFLHQRLISLYKTTGQKEAKANQEKLYGYLK
ncbi:MAG: DUF3808 domain-containing protein [Candidatus Nitronauta litoralis]|uniref:DUF3808 domain-containing protein n=1 Tax=Candidatus Nitronauta litoralis TaxID=2705533 RepID=A0A7T0BY17_9BACT|nr:MAG: DUF3808 domain-containing protein [Candidatus Nitronauta litoralis]